MFEKEAEEKYCKGCKLRMEQCLWAWRNTNGLNEPNEKNCSCKEVPAYIKGAEFGFNKANKEIADRQLTKAKELLKGWLGDFYNPKAFYQQRAKLVEQSERFLSEVEK